MELSQTDALRAYARMMNTLDVKHIEPLLAENFHYSSQWVFAEITSKKEYLDYIRPKLETIAASGAKVYAEMAVHDGWGGDPCVVMAQGSPSNLVATVLAKVDGGRITQFDMGMLPSPAEAKRSGEYPSQIQTDSTSSGAKRGKRP
jgi:hypothetical protein